MKCTHDDLVDLNSGIVILRWFDNKAVQLISNYIGNEPIDEAEHWSKSARKMITVSRPKIVKLYNSAMGGVDLFDMFQAFYRLDNKSHRWYMQIFYWILASSVVTAWLRYHKDFDSMKLSKGKSHFQENRSKCPLSNLQWMFLLRFWKMQNLLLLGNEVNLLQVSWKKVLHLNDQEKHLISKKYLQIYTRFDNVDHWSVHRDERLRCFLCKEKTRKKKAYVYITKERNCFCYFHEIWYFH